MRLFPRLEDKQKSCVIAVGYLLRVTSKAIKSSESLINDAVMNGKAQYRSAPKQIEYWARMGKIVDEIQTYL